MVTINSSRQQLIERLNELHRQFFDKESDLLNLLGEIEADYYGGVSRGLRDVRVNMELIKEVIKELEQR